MLSPGEVDPEGTEFKKKLTAVTSRCWSSARPRDAQVELRSHAEQRLREWPLPVNPLGFAVETGAFRHHADLFGMEFVTAFSPNRLAFSETDLQIASEANGLIGQRS